ncbi:MAG: hypothetical protein JWP97_2620 [Labilithrix sp.]|nr:hypothetical protein [Labilithrix sp.]
MRASSFTVPLVLAAVFAVAGCSLLQLTQSGDDNAAKSASTTTADAAAAETVDGGIIGGGCGIDTATGQTLCLVTSACPTLIVDHEALPDCGFRIRGTITELVCACDNAICSMGTYATCAQAAALLTSQSEVTVCAQVAEGRCAVNTAPAPTPSSTSSASSTSSSSTSSSSGSSCDRTCLQECGSGAGCASICGC